MADEECKQPRRILFSGTVSAGNLLNAAVIIVGALAFLLEGKAAIKSLEQGLAEVKLEFRDHKRDLREELREINRRVDGKSDK